MGIMCEGSVRLARVQRGRLAEEGTINKLFIRERETQIKPRWYY